MNKRNVISALEDVKKHIDARQTYSAIDVLQTVIESLQAEKDPVVRVRVWEREEGKHRLKTDDKHFQADIIAGEGFKVSDHHGLGRTAAEALYHASEHFLRYEHTLRK